MSGAIATYLVLSKQEPLHLGRGDSGCDNGPVVLKGEALQLFCQHTRVRTCDNVSELWMPGGNFLEVDFGGIWHLAAEKQRRHPVSACAWIQVTGRQFLINRHECGQRMV
jgi:hypothetical protein